MLSKYQDKNRVVFNEPKWMEGNRSILKERKAKFLEGLKKSKNAGYLETLPSPRYPGVSDLRMRKRKTKIVRKFVFDSKI